jgi:SAM-dependent methyltransferase
MQNMQAMSLIDDAPTLPTRAALADRLPPPDLAIQFGGGDFLDVGLKTLKRLVADCGLKPCQRVLDVGSGAGRLAVALTGYLDGRGSYEGFDTYPFGLDWCRENLTPRFPNFTFRQADVHNRLYNPRGAVHAKDFVFPYPDADFDLVVLNSVFTHMLPEDVVGYLTQIARVLKPGGHAFITFYLLNDAARALLPASTGYPRLGHRYGAFYVENPADPEEAVGYEETFARHAIAAAGLDITSITPGSWCGRPYEGYVQDMVVARKG